MSIDKLKRVIGRLREDNPNGKCSLQALRRVIIFEIGYSDLAYKNATKALVRLKWIKSLRGNRVIITGKDITNDF